MISIRNLTTATPDTVRAELLRTVETLSTMVRRQQDVMELLQEVRRLLDALPLASDEHSTAANRLSNAHRYLVSQERGAARYELRLLAGSLRQDRVREPRRRRRGQRPSA